MFSRILPLSELHLTHQACCKSAPKQMPNVPIPTGDEVEMALLDLVAQREDEWLKATGKNRGSARESFFLSLTFLDRWQRAKT